MRAGQRVTYVDAAGEKPAVIDAVTGAGPSWFKVLALRLAGRLLEHVPHQKDAADGEPFWREGDPAPAAPRRRPRRRKP